MCALTDDDAEYDAEQVDAKDVENDKHSLEVANAYRNHSSACASDLRKP